MNQHQVTVTRGDDRTLTFEVGADYTGGSARMLVEDLFTKTGLGLSVASGVTTITADIAEADTEDCPDYRHPHRYEIEVTTAAGDIRTVRRGLFVVVPDLETVCQPRNLRYVHPELKSAERHRAPVAHTHTLHRGPLRPASGLGGLCLAVHLPGPKSERSR